MAQRIHLFGAAGSGTTTVGAALAAELSVPHLDADRFYWVETDPPFTRKNEPARRVALVEEEIAGRAGWVLSGSMCSWGDPLLGRLTRAVFLHLDPALRMARLVERERRRYGARIQPGGDMHSGHLEFLDWAERYDTAGTGIRSRTLHEAWMKRLPCPVLRLDAARTVDALVSEIVARTECGARPTDVLSSPPRASPPPRRGSV